MSREAWRAADLFAGLSEAELDAVAPALSPVAVLAGQDVITEGEAGDDMYLLTHGRVRVCKSMIVKGLAVPLLDADKLCKVLAELDASTSPFFGEMALLDRDIRSASVTAVTDCRFARINRDRFYRLLAEHPDIGAKLALALARRLAAMVRKNNDELIKLTTALALVLSGRGRGRV